MRDSFSWLEKSAKVNFRFREDLGDFLTDVPVVGFATVVYRPGYNKRYKGKYGDNRWALCKTAYAILIDRVVKYVKSKGGILHIRFEESGEKEDRSIIEYAKDMKVHGLPFDPVTSKKYGSLSPHDYRDVIVGRPKRKKKANSLLQIADLYLYPMAKRKYDPRYPPWLTLFSKGKVIDALISEQDYQTLGIKYSCFDE